MGLDTLTMTSQPVLKLGLLRQPGGISSDVDRVR